MDFDSLKERKVSDDDVSKPNTPKTTQNPVVDPSEEHTYGPLLNIKSRVIF